MPVIFKSIYIQAMYEKIRQYTSSIVPFTDEEWAAKVPYLTTQQLNKGDFLVREGQICRAVHFIDSGMFRTYNLVGDKEVTTNFFFESSYASDYVSFVTQTPSKEYIQALEDSVVISFPYDRMQELYEQYPAFQKYGRLTAEKIFTSIYRRQQEFLFFSPKERYLNLMKKRPKVIRHIPQVYIASYLGITPEYLSRIRNELKNEAEIS